MLICSTHAFFTEQALIINQIKIGKKTLVCHYDRTNYNKTEKYMKAVSAVIKTSFFLISSGFDQPVRCGSRLLKKG